MQHILITGAFGNLGKAVVKNVLEKDYMVSACISKNDLVPEQQTNIDYYVLDLTDADACKILCNEVGTKYSQINDAVLTVGGFIPGNVDAVTKADFDKMILLNFTTAFNLVQPLLKQMKKQEKGGTIILIGSEPGLDGAKASGSVAYGFSKSLLFRLAELINAEGQGKNISAHVVVPTTMDTPQNRAAMPNADFSKWATTDSIAQEIAGLLVH